MDLETLEEMLQNSDRDLVSTLGGKANLGGTHANAVCELAGIEPNIDTKDASAEKILQSLKSLLTDLSNSDSGHILLKPSKDFDDEGLAKHIVTLENNSIRDRFL